MLVTPLLLMTHGNDKKTSEFLKEIDGSAEKKEKKVTQKSTRKLSFQLPSLSIPWIPLN